ncbi:uncharacterized protein [Coffea arabica]|uniref:SWIM-type domain-containing protein n=1 Tax=Coffea arabica TaxID=13443 RepID=A0ABM4UYN5_COFAR
MARYRAKKKAEKLIEGDYAAQYNKLWNYCREVKRANLVSNVFMTVTEDGEEQDRFERLYMCLLACKKGFLAGYRPISGLDVEVENKLTSKWFVTELVTDLDIKDEDKWTFMTDKQKGLIQALHKLLPVVEHRMRVQHIYNNFKKQHSGLALNDRIWSLARASYKNLFVALMMALKEFNEGAFKWLVDNTTPQYWVRAYFCTSPKCDILLNNLCESFNSSILEARDRPILGMLETIRLYLMARMETKREWMRKSSGSVCPKILKKLEKVKNAASRCIATYSGDWFYEMRFMYGDRYSVNLASMKCSCRRWELNSIPCSHAMSASALTKEPPKSFVHEFYS